MPGPLAARLQTLVPFWGDPDGDTVAVRTLRFSLVCVAVLTPAFWAFFRFAHPGAFDPVWVRVVLVAGALGLLGASYRSGWVRRRAPEILLAVSHALVAWYGVMAAVNGLGPDHVVSYLFLWVGTAMMVSVGWDRPGPFASVLVAGAAVGVAVSFSVGAEDGGVSPTLFAGVSVAGSAVFFVGFYGRLRASADLRRSEARLAEAERLAETGSWTRDLATGRRTWSDGTYAVFGLAPGSELPPFDTVVHPDDRDACRADLERLVASGEASWIRYRIVRPGGEVRWLDGTADILDGHRLRGVVLDVTDHVAREAALVEARDQANAAHRSQSAFLANMSHEIWTPLTAIIGYAQVLQEEVAAEHAELVAPIEAGGRRLLSTLNSVLDLARMEAGETDLVLRPVDPAAEAAEVVLLLRSQAEAKGLTLGVVPPPAPLSVLADPDALARVVTNLLSNALKFTEHGGVMVSVAAVGGCAEIAVADTGRGMDAAFLAEIYEPFRQASTGWARSHEGTGLGLTITRRLVDAMGGTVRAQSEPGRGSRFTVSVPLAPAAGAPAAPTAASAPGPAYA